MILPQFCHGFFLEIQCFDILIKSLLFNGFLPYHDDSDKHLGLKQE